MINNDVYPVGTRNFVTTLTTSFPRTARLSTDENRGNNLVSSVQNTNDHCLCPNERNSIWTRRVRTLDACVQTRITRCFSRPSSSPPPRSGETIGFYGPATPSFVFFFLWIFQTEMRLWTNRRLIALTCGLNPTKDVRRFRTINKTTTGGLGNVQTIPPSTIGTVLTRKKN